MNYSEKLSFALLDFDASVTTTYYNTSTGPHHPHPYYLMYTIPYLPLISQKDGYSILKLCIWFANECPKIWALPYV